LAASPSTAAPRSSPHDAGSLRLYREHFSQLTAQHALRILNKDIREILEQADVRMTTHRIIELAPRLAGRLDVLARR
jgi:hypothetical protein